MDLSGTRFIATFSGPPDAERELKMVPAQEIEGFSDLQLNIEAQLDCTFMTLRDLLNLAPESTVKLSRPAGDNIDLLIGGSVVCSGEIVIINDAISVRITDFREED